MDHSTSRVAMRLHQIQGENRMAFACSSTLHMDALRRDADCVAAKHWQCPLNNEERHETKITGWFFNL